MSKTPKLRFKEFSGDWEEKKLGELGEFFKGSILSKSNLSEEGNSCVLYGELYTRYSEVIKNVISKTDLNDNNFVIGNKNDVLIPSSGESATDIATASCLQEDNVILGGDLNVFRSTKLNGIFTSYQLNNSKKHEIAKLAQGASVVHVYNNQLSKLKLNVPSKEEQEKIASFFSLIDDKISLQSDKVEALKDYKKGIMQKIFSRELRFKDDDGSDYPEWEVITIEKVANLEKGFTPNTKNEKNWIGDVPWLSIADMKQGKYVSEVSKYISNEALGKKALVPKGTLIMSFKLTLGRLAIINRDLMTNEAICHFYWRNKNINTEYMYYYLSTSNIESFGCRAAKGITLNNDSLNSIVVKLPVIKEQNKISDILTKIDYKLQKEQEKLDSLTEYKKGLLQQMFV